MVVYLHFGKVTQKTLIPTEKQTHWKIHSSVSYLLLLH